MATTTFVDITLCFMAYAILRELSVIRVSIIVDPSYRLLASYNAIESTVAAVA